MWWIVAAVVDVVVVVVDVVRAVKVVAVGFDCKHAFLGLPSFVDTQ